MRIIRIYYAGELGADLQVVLPADASKYILKVLRLRVGAKLRIFNGMGGEYEAQLIKVEGNQAILTVMFFLQTQVESPLDIHLGQGISRAEKMDWVIQKAVELGVKEITPLFTERCGVKLPAERLEKRMQHWRSVVVSACEQSGRCILPAVHTAMPMQQWLQSCNIVGFICDPQAQNKLASCTKPLDNKLRLLIGPEGGLSEIEIQQAQQHNFKSLSLGPRVLRTETAAVVALSILQAQWGDLA